jgi:hypothetical protein
VTVSNIWGNFSFILNRQVSLNLWINVRWYVKLKQSCMLFTRRLAQSIKLLPCISEARDLLPSEHWDRWFESRQGNRYSCAFFSTHIHCAGATGYSAIQSLIRTLWTDSKFAIRKALRRNSGVYGHDEWSLLRLLSTSRQQKTLLQ